MNKRKITVFLLTVLLLSFVAACKANPEGATTAVTQNAPSPSLQTTKPQETATQPPVEIQKITASEAEEIALAHAGLTREQVERLHTTEDYDDGVPEYEVQFWYERMEYEYEIHAEDGTIRSFDKEYD